MKTDKEFLDEVYEKARMLERDKDKKPLHHRRSMRGYALAAAALVIITIFPLSKLKGNTQKVEPYNLASVSRTLPVSGEEQKLIEQLDRSDIVVEATANGIQKDMTNLSIEKIYKGDYNSRTIDVKFSVEFLQKHEIKKGTRMILFLEKSGDGYRAASEDSDVYMCSDKDEFVNSLSNKVSTSQLKNMIGE